MTHTEGERPLTVTYGKFDSLVLYEVTEDELELLKNGPTSSIYFNFAIALIPLSISFFGSIFTVEFKTNSIFIVFLVMALVSLVAGVMSLTIWISTRKSYNSVIKRIKSRTDREVTAPVPSFTSEEGIASITSQE